MVNYTLVTIYKKKFKIFLMYIVCLIRRFAFSVSTV